MRLILGSASPRRRDLLAQIGVVADDVRPANIDETPLKAEKPRVYAARMASEKNRATIIADDEVILTADTIVCVGTRILGKPVDAEQAREYLSKLSGRRHKVITAVAVRSTTGFWAKQVETVVRFKHLSPEDITQYIATKEWMDKAGGYGMQGVGGALIPSINGSYTNVVGLPLTETIGLLRAAGYSITLGGSKF